MRLSLRGVLMLMRERMNWNGVLRYETRNGNEVVKASARKHKNHQLLLFYFFCTYAGWRGNSVVFGQRSRLAGGFGAAIIHNVSLGAFFQGFIPRT